MDSTIIAAIITAVGAIIAEIIGRWPNSEHSGGWRRTLVGISRILAVILLALMLVIAYNLGKKSCSTPQPAETTEPVQTSETTHPAETGKEAIKVPIGSIKKFGSYEQDKKETNGTEDLEWVVLAQEDNRILMVSRSGIEAAKYNYEKSNTDWENSTIRQWLNGTFLDEAFTEEEQAYIVAATIIQHKNRDNPTCDQGKETTDKVFLMSAWEYEAYMCNNGNVAETYRCGTPSKVIRSKVELSNDLYSWWWLRTSARDGEHACAVTAYGSVNYTSHEVNAIGMVRPAMWVSAELWMEK